MVRPVRTALTWWLVLSDPTDWFGVTFGTANVLSVPHSKYAVVASPFGITLAWRVAPATERLSAAFVCTVGGFMGDAVVRLAIAPLVVPAELEAASRK